MRYGMLRKMRIKQHMKNGYKRQGHQKLVAMI